MDGCEFIQVLACIEVQVDGLGWRWSAGVLSSKFLPQLWPKVKELPRLFQKIA